MSVQVDFNDSAARKRGWLALSRINFTSRAPILVASRRKVLAGEGPFDFAQSRPAPQQSTSSTSTESKAQIHLDL